ncbi:MAG: hypothetical protein ACKVQK_06030 [Burkholderiales bacterium]
MTTSTNTVPGNSGGTGVASVPSNAIGAATPVGFNLQAGWNLLGAGQSDPPLSVATAFGDQAKYSSVWKWIGSSKKWAFYSPLMADGGQSYAVANGYLALTTIDAGEGFWVNAR